MPLQPTPSTSSHSEFRPVDKRADRRAERRTHDRAQKGPHPSAHTVPFELEDKSCSQVLFDLMQTAPKDGMTVRAIIHSLGERGLLMACMLFSIPSMLPIPLPGISIPQGLVIMLIGLGILLNRAPLLPERLLEYRLPHKTLFLILEKGARLFHRIEKLSYPRLLPMTHGWVHGLNGVLLVLGAAVLMAPLPIPFSNVLPAYGILFTAFGTLQRDGWLVIAGYVMYFLTVLYISLVFVFGMSWIYGLVHLILRHH
ncbi:MAG: exopolysaccharide synthesis protein ExoD [Fibrobacteres bacterium]|nr:exopolysaccharide synthesis protein ExoD [Fibrobacterota bacterium]